jgi:hypothetical protein
MTSKNKKGRGVDHGKTYYLCESKDAMSILKKYRNNQNK